MTLESKLILGDCLEEMKNLPDNSVDMVLADLPYGTTRNPWDSIIPLGLLWQQYNRIVKINGAMVFTAAPPFDKILAVSNIENFKYEWIWHKNKATGHLNSKKMPLRAHENILIFYRKQPTYNPQMTFGHKPANIVYEKKNENYEQRNYNHADRPNYSKGKTTRYPRSVLNIKILDNIKKEKFHPTQKPIELMAYMIKTYTNENDMVLDNAMGSGTTCAAAKALGRRYIGIELKEKYYNFAVERVNKISKGDLDNMVLVSSDVNVNPTIIEEPLIEY